MIVPTLLYGNETWILNQKDCSSVIAAKMAYLRSDKSCTRMDCFSSENMTQRSNAIPTTENIDSYSKQWGEDSLRTDRSRSPKIASEYNPKGRRDEGRPGKRWKFEAIKGQGYNP
jgi:hypothetical protein